MLVCLHVLDRTLIARITDVMVQFLLILPILRKFVAWDLILVDYLLNEHAIGLNLFFVAGHGLDGYLHVQGSDVIATRAQVC